MYFYSSTDKISNILLITHANTPEHQKRNMFKRNMFKPESRKFLLHYVIFADASKNNPPFWKIKVDFFLT